MSYSNDANRMSSDAQTLPLPIQEVRARIAARLDPCYRSCPGWAVFHTNDRGLEIERCDACFCGLPEELKVWDDDVQQLPEAIAALEDERSCVVSDSEVDEIPPSTLFMVA